MIKNISKNFNDIDDILDLIEVVSSIYSFCNDLNDSFIRYKNHAKYLKELALQLDSIYKLSENKKLLSEKGEGLLRKKKKKKDKNKGLGEGEEEEEEEMIYANYKKDLEGDIPPVIINFYNYTRKFIAHVKKVKKKNFVERLWYISVNDEKMDGVKKKKKKKKKN
ncbi:hypothetical protein H8356DRAFT_1068200 [Neocallimastix lanati (nom. inval.)]|nr:hypothetical protein H8356DRAFT_1068200 [Neocallimastix sp. JGI-2020a]